MYCYYIHPLYTAFYGVQGPVVLHAPTLQHAITQTPEALFRTHWLFAIPYYVVELYCIVMYRLVHDFVIEPAAQILCYMGLARCFEGPFPFLVPSQLVWNLSSIDNWEECQSAVMMHDLWALIRLGCLVITVALIVLGCRAKPASHLKPE